MGAPKQIDVFQRALEADDEQMAEEDAASRKRMERYRAMSDSAAKAAAIAGENGWRTDVGMKAL